MDSPPSSLLISSRSPTQQLDAYNRMKQSFKEYTQTHHDTPSPNHSHPSSSRDLDRLPLLLDLPSPLLSATPTTTSSLRQNPPARTQTIHSPSTNDNGIGPSPSPTTPIEERYAITNATPRVTSIVNPSLVDSSPRTLPSHLESFTDADNGGGSESHPSLNRMQQHSLDMIEEAAISGSPPAFSPSPSSFDYEPQQQQQPASSANGDHRDADPNGDRALEEVGQDGTHTAQSSPIPSAMAVEGQRKLGLGVESRDEVAANEDDAAGIKADEELPPSAAAASSSEPAPSPLKPFRASSFLSEPAPSPVGSPQLGISRSASMTSKNGAAETSMLHDEDFPEAFSKQRSDSQPLISSADWTEAKVVPSPEPLIPDSLEVIGDISMSEAAPNHMMLHEVFEGVQLNSQGNDEVVLMEDDRSHGARKQVQLKIDATQRLPVTPVARVKRIPGGGQRRNSEVLQPVHQRSNWEPSQQKQRDDKGGSSHRRGSLPNNVAFAPTANSALNIPLHHLPISSLTLTGHASHKRKHESPVPLQQLDPSSSADRMNTCELCQSCEACALHWKNIIATEDIDKSSDATHHPLSHGHIHSRPNSPLHSNYNDPNLHHHHHHHDKAEDEEVGEDEDMLSPSSAAAEKSLSFLSSYQSHNGASFHKANYAIRTAESLDNSPFKLPTSLGMSPMISTKKILKMIQGHVYPVQTLLDVRLQNGHIYYFVEWKGFPDYFNSWEPAESLATNCSQLIEQFEEAHGKIEGGDEDVESVSSARADDDAHSIKSQEKHSVFNFRQKQERATEAPHEESEDLDLELHGHADTATAVPSKSPTPPPRLATGIAVARLR